MCRKLVVTNEIFLGTRAICYEAYSLPKGGSRGTDREADQRCLERHYHG